MRSFVAEVGTGGSSHGSAAASSPITVALCEGHGVFRRRLMIDIERDGDITVIADADLPSGLGPILASVLPSVMTVDMSAPYDDVASPIRTMRSTDGIQRLVRALPAVPVLALAGPADDPALALIAGAQGAIPKSDALRSGRDAIRELVAGSMVIDRRAARSLSAMIENDLDRCGLNRQHVEILHQVSSGRSLLELARFFRTEVEVLQQRLEQVVLALRASRSPS